MALKHYSIGDNRRLWAAIQLAVLAFLTANLAPLLDPYLPDMLDIGSDAIALRGVSLGVLGVLLFALNRWIWRWPLINRYWIRIPDLNGTWIGTLNRIQYPGLEEEKGLPVVVHIKQEWLRISYSLENMVEESLSKPTRSDSTSVSIEGSFDEGFTLTETFEFTQGCGMSVMRFNPETGGDRLEGEYMSSVPRTGRMDIRRIHNNLGLQRGTVQKFTSNDREDYLAITIDYGLIADDRRRLSRRVSQDQYSALMAGRIRRDGDTYHLTIVAPQEFQRLDPEQRESLQGKTVGFSVVGLGRISKDDAETWFTVVRSPHAEYLRKNVGLPYKDFHITLGFTPHDIYDRPKDMTTLVE